MGIIAGAYDPSGLRPPPQLRWGGMCNEQRRQLT
jgi:hypothetical protein